MFNVILLMMAKTLKKNCLEKSLHSLKPNILAATQNLNQCFYLKTYFLILSLPFQLLLVEKTAS